MSESFILSGTLLLEGSMLVDCSFYKFHPNSFGGT